MGFRHLPLADALPDERPGLDQTLDARLWGVEHGVTASDHFWPALYRYL